MILRTTIKNIVPKEIVVTTDKLIRIISMASINQVFLSKYINTATSMPTENRHKIEIKYKKSWYPSVFPLVIIA